MGSDKKMFKYIQPLSNPSSFYPHFLNLPPPVSISVGTVNKNVTRAGAFPINRFRTRPTIFILQIINCFILLKTFLTKFYVTEGQIKMSDPPNKKSDSDVKIFRQSWPFTLL